MPNNEKMTREYQAINGMSALELRNRWTREVLISIGKSRLLGRYALTWRRQTVLNNDVAKPDDELQAFLDRYGKNPQNPTTLPIDVPYDEHFAPYFNDTHLKPLADEQKEKPGFMATAGHEIMTQSEIGRAYTYAAEQHEV